MNRTEKRDEIFVKKASKQKISSTFNQTKINSNMKKLMIVFGSFLLVTTSISQTITSANIVNLGDTVFNAIDVSPSVNIGTAGTGNTWNFGTLLANGRDTIVFSNPNTISCASTSFSSASYKFAQDTNFGFLEKSSSSLQLLGLSNGSICVASQNPETVIEFPSTYGSTFTDVAMTQTVVSGADAGFPAADSIRVNSTTNILSNFDASGTLTTPMGIFSCIRQNLERRTTSLVYAKISGFWNPSPILTQNDTAYSHQYWSDATNAKYPLISYDIDASGSLTGQIVWMTRYASNPTSGIDEKEVLSVSIFPNPALDFITIESKDPVTKATIFDVSGKMILSKENPKGNRMEIQELPKGVYFLRVETESVVGNAKFIKE